MSTTSRLTRLADFAEQRSIRPRFPPPVERAISKGGVVLYVALLLFNAWSWYTGTDDYQETHGDAKLAHPSATDCEIARTIIADTHGSGGERQLLRTFGGGKLSLATFASSWYKPTAPPVGYPVAGADADWRWCPSLGRYVRSIGWLRLGDVLRQQTEVNISPPAYNVARNEAVTFVDAMPDPLLADGWVGRDRLSAIYGNLVYLKRDQHTGAWTIVARSPSN